MAEKNIKEIVGYFLKNNILLSSDIIWELKKLDEREIKNIQDAVSENNITVLDKETIDLIKKHKGINYAELEKAKAKSEKYNENKLYNKILNAVKEEQAPAEATQKDTNTKKEQEKRIKVLISYKEESKKRDIQDFVSYFNKRYKAIEKMLSGRQELQNLTSIARLLNKKDKDNVSVIAMVYGKETTKTGNIALTIEDPSGTIKALINKNKPELYEKALSIVHDEVIAINGVNGNNIVFVNDVIWPDIPFKELKKSPDEAYAIFLSDFHFGSDHFLEEEFKRFLDWINCRIGNEQQKETAKKVKYIFVIGDLVDGCGVYPGQEKELVIKDIYQQYEECANYLKQIPEDKAIIICPGNHDAMRISEPQPELYKDFAVSLWQLPNVFMVSNPALINMHSSENFPGFDVLLYHGYSFDYFVANVDSIRAHGGYDRADLLMKFLLQRRHLAPTHSSTLYIPETTLDPLVIEHIPDFFITGHIHKSSASNYKNITLISGSCWQKKTPFQEKVGHHPEPCRVPIVNLQTREIKIMKF